MFYADLLLLTQIRETFEKAVIDRLMSDVPFGILLSGGLDSSLVASIAVKYIKEHPEIYGETPTINTFSIGAKDSSDLPYARMVSEFLGTKHHEIDFTVEANRFNNAANLKNLNPFKSLGSLANLKNPEDSNPSGTIGNEKIIIINSILWDLMNSILFLEK